MKFQTIGPQGQTKIYEADRPSVAACKAYTQLKSSNEDVLNIKVFSEGLKKEKVYSVKTEKTKHAFYTTKPIAKKIKPE